MSGKIRSKSFQDIQLLTPEEELAAKTKIMQMPEKLALETMNKSGFKCGKTKYYELLKTVRSKYGERKRQMVIHGFEDQHIERIDETKTIISELWKKYHQSKKAMDGARILKIIGEFQPLTAILAQDMTLIHDKQEELKLKQKERDRVK